MNGHYEVSAECVSASSVLCAEVRNRTSKGFLFPFFFLMNMYGIRV